MLPLPDAVTSGSPPGVPSDLLIASGSAGDAQADASRFLVENACFLTKSTIDGAQSRYRSLRAIYDGIPSWMMMPLFVICMVVAVVLGIPLFIVFTKLLKDPATFMQLTSLASLGWIVAAIALFV